jgi:rhomboid protease GluP
LREFRRYPLTYTIIVVNILIYLFSALLSGSLIDMDMRVLVDLGALYGPLTIADAQWWRLLTAMFLHGGMTHLLMNMFSLYLIGRGVEQYFSRSAYLALYLFSGVIGGLVSLFMHPHAVGIGASGAIFGIFGALAGFFLAHRDRIGTYTRMFMKDFAVVLGLNFFIGVAIPSVDMSAHIGGLFVGFIGGYIIAKYPRSTVLFAVVMTGIAYAMMQMLRGSYAQILF